MCVSRSCQLEDVCLEVATVSARRGAPGDIVKLTVPGSLRLHPLVLARAMTRESSAYF